MLIEIGQILGGLKGKCTTIGDAVPWLPLAREDWPHVSTLDVDVGLNAKAIGPGEYATLVGALQGHGCPARNGGAEIDVLVGFLMPRGAADNADLATRFCQLGP